MIKWAVSLSESELQVKVSWSLNEVIGLWIWKRLKTRRCIDLQPLQGPLDNARCLITCPLSADGLLERCQMVLPCSEAVILSQYSTAKDAGNKIKVTIV